MVNNQQLMMSNFQSAMAKLAVVGQNVNSLIDCSDVIPQATPPLGIPATYALLFLSSLGHPIDNFFLSLPAGTTEQDIQQACAASPFPSVAAARTSSYSLTVSNPSPIHILSNTASSQETQIPACPDGDLNLADCPS